MSYLNTTDFVAYDSRFFDIIGPNATVEHVQKLTYQVHEAPCYIKDTNQLFFVEWGPPGGDDGIHSWQYLLDVETNTLRNITTNPPTYNVHGCVYYNHSIHVVTDGYSDLQTGELAKIDPHSHEKTTLLNNYLVQPFAGFNDLEIDQVGNFWLTDSKSGWVCSCYHFLRQKAHDADSRNRADRLWNLHPQQTRPSTSLNDQPFAPR